MCFGCVSQISVLSGLAFRLLILQSKEERHRKIPTSKHKTWQNTPLPKRVEQKRQHEHENVMTMTMISRSVKLLTDRSMMPRLLSFCGTYFVSGCPWSCRNPEPPWLRSAPPPLLRLSPRSFARLRNSALFFYCVFIRCSFGVDLQIRSESCKLLAQVFNVSFRCEFLNLLRLYVSFVLVLVQLCVAPCLMVQVKQQEKALNSSDTTTTSWDTKRAWLASAVASCSRRSIWSRIIVVTLPKGSADTW